MLGEAISVLTALLWAGSTVILAKTLKNIDPLNVNAFKTLFASVGMLPVAFIMGEMQSIPRVDPYGLFAVVVAALIGFGIGDTCLLKSMTQIGVSRSYTIAYAYPFFTMLLATAVLGEQFLLRYLIGTAAIFLGIINLIITADGKVGGGSWKGLLTAFAAALSWAVGTIVVSLGLRKIDAVLANTIRYPLLFVFLLLLSQPWARKPDLNRRNLLLLLVSGVLGMTLGGVTFLLGIQMIGTSRTVSLSSSSPIWASLMVSFFLKERVTLRLLVSSVLVVLGIYFLT